MSARNPFRPGVKVTGRVLRDFAAAALATSRGRGARVHPSSEGGESIYVQDRATFRPVRFWARLNALGPPVEDVPGVPGRWRYTFAEIAKVAPGYGGWQLLANGRTSSTIGRAYNAIEDGFTDNGIQGVGVDAGADTFPDGFKVAPILVECPVLIEEVPVSDGTLEAWIVTEPDFDGACA